MLILALDTTSEWGGAAIFRDGECLAIGPHQGTANYSVTLFQDVNRLFGETGLKWDEIDIFVAANGPGSFTGIRVGLAAVQGWALAFGKSARGVSTLEAMAEEAQAESFYVLPILDARRGEFYARMFHYTPATQINCGNSQFRRKIAPAGEGVALKPERFMSFVEMHIPPGKNCIVIARQNDPAANALRLSISPQLQWKTIGNFLVPAIARLAYLAGREERPVLPQEISAYYIRRSDAELNWKG